MQPEESNVRSTLHPEIPPFTMWGSYRAVIAEERLSSLSKEHI